MKDKLTAVRSFCSANESRERDESDTEFGNGYSRACDEIIALLDLPCEPAKKTLEEIKGKNQ